MPTRFALPPYIGFRGVQAPLRGLGCVVVAAAAAATAAAATSDRFILVQIHCTPDPFLYRLDLWASNPSKDNNEMHGVNSNLSHHFSTA